MKTCERYFYVSMSGIFKKGDVIQRDSIPDYTALEEDHNILLYNDLLIPAKYVGIKLNPKVSLLEISLDITEAHTGDKLDEVIIFTCIEDNIDYDNAIELVSDFEESDVLASL